MNNHSNSRLPDWAFWLIGAATVLAAAILILSAVLGVRAGQRQLEIQTRQQVGPGPVLEATVVVPQSQSDTDPQIPDAPPMEWLHPTSLIFDVTAHGRTYIVPAMIAVVTPLAFGLIFGRYALGGFLIGGLLSAIQLAIFSGNAGGAMDNAKKYVEEGHFGGKGSKAHDAGVVGDTVGDPLKDTVGPSLDILIKLMSVIALVFASLFPIYPIFM
jgi:hypothetical protein